MTKNNYDFKKKPLDYDECFAKIMLETFFPNEFYQLDVFDCPDLQSESLDTGIEVTNAVNKKQKENEALYSKIGRDQISGKELEKFIEKINSNYKPKKIYIGNETYKQELNRYQNTFLIGIPEPVNFDRVKTSFAKKLQKLNTDHYKDFSHNYLYINSGICLPESLFLEAIHFMAEYQKDYIRNFKEVFIYIPGFFYRINLFTKKYSFFKVNNQFELAMMANDIVEKSLH